MLSVIECPCCNKGPLEQSASLSARRKRKALASLAALLADNRRQDVMEKELSHARLRALLAFHAHRLHLPDPRQGLRTLGQVFLWRMLCSQLVVTNVVRVLLTMALAKVRLIRLSAVGERVWDGPRSISWGTLHLITNLYKIALIITTEAVR